MLQTHNWKRPGWHAVGPILTTVGVLLLVLSPVGYRLGWFGVPIALLRLIPAGLLVCALGLVVSLAAIVRTPAGVGWSEVIAPWAAVVVSIAVSILPIVGIVHARHVPRIHDITTDTEMPPSFVALAPERVAAPNGLEYGGADVAAQQKEGYPDLVTVFSKTSPDAMFARARKAAQDLGWQIADASESQWRIEAVEATLLYGFKDDIVVRIRSDANGCRLDVRSASRVGHSDLGGNAARIRKFLARPKENSQ